METPTEGLIDDSGDETDAPEPWRSVWELIDEEWEGEEAPMCL